MRLSVPQRRRTRPSLIPLIDVMLVLLFFFMLASSYAEHGRMRLELAPDARPGAGATGDTLRVELMAGGALRIAGQLQPLAAALPALQAATEVRLSPAPGVPLQSLLDTWQQLRAAGVKAQLAEAAP